VGYDGDLRLFTKTLDEIVRITPEVITVWFNDMRPTSLSKADELFADNIY
jgi:hypothetical protein